MKCVEQASEEVSQDSPPEVDCCEQGIHLTPECNPLMFNAKLGELDELDPHDHCPSE